MKYASTPPNRRGPVVGQIVGGAGWSPRTDFYLGMRHALVSDRRTTRDGAAVEAAAVNANTRKQARYSALASAWSNILGRWAACSSVHVERTRIAIGGLSVRVPAPIAEEHEDGTIELVKVHLAEPELDPTTIDMFLRLYQRAYAAEYPEAGITFVDLSRGGLWTSEGRDLAALDFWIETDAAGLAYALRTAA
ncbi:hypothetical protein ACQFYA_20485 [Promicromonospora sp. Marseille-Q5078]